MNVFQRKTRLAELHCDLEQKKSEVLFGNTGGAQEEQNDHTEFRK